MIRKCKKCGFILGTRNNMKEQNGVCQACINAVIKKSINWSERQNWLTEYIDRNKNKNSKYECVIGVSGGKDSCAIVKRLIDYHNVKHPLLVHVCDEFTQSNAGKHNLNNLVHYYNLDLLNFRCEPQTFISETRKSFIEKLHPLEWIEKQLYSKPFEVAKAFKIPIVFMGENPAFEYGETDQCEIFSPLSDDDTKVIYFGSIWPYSNNDSLHEAKKIGFKTLSDFNDWQRQGSADDYTQIDSIGYMMQHWTKFIKYGFQRVSDLACRFVREGVLTKEQAEQMIKDYDWICDPYAKKDFCNTIGITTEEFNKVVDRFANTELLVKDSNNNWRRKDLL